MKPTLNIHMIEPRTNKLGPFHRFVFWVNNCDKDCPGCIVPRQLYIRNDVLIEDLVQQILATPDIEGLTISGGEPFLQARGIASLIEQVRAKRDLGVIVYTGYVMAELTKPHHLELLKHIDLIIDGRYVKALDDGKSLRGSSNQKVIPLTPRYAAIIDQHYGLPGRQAEMKIIKNEYRVVGVPSSDHLKTYDELHAIVQKIRGKPNGG
jgi:anaerobic ribonucleoside-triphosphate reductase activating protein